ncbi:MAG: hypothetical protein ACKVOB_11695 [Sphingomonas sp.]
MNRPRSDETLAKCADFRKRNANQNTVPLYLEEVAQHWATPRTITGGANSQREARGAGGPDLQEQVEHWSTPRASDGEKGGPNMAFGAGGTPLPTQAAHWPTPMAGSVGTDSYNAAGNSDFSRRVLELTENWPTPLTADDGRKVTARSAQTQLCIVAESWPEPHSRPDHPTPAGQKSSPQRRRLNPLFVEWLMGWPEGLSGFDTAATASCHSPALSPGCGCMDCWLNRQRELLADLLAIGAPVQGDLLWELYR